MTPQATSQPWAIAALLTVLYVTGTHGLGHNIAGGWSYSWGEEDPSEWSKDFPICGGENQSPINIETWHVQYDKDLPYFNFTDYGNADEAELLLENAGGHTAEVKLSGTPIYLQGGGLDPSTTYQLAQFHFHWGSRDYTGSEHTINGRHYPLELHLVHANTQAQDSDPGGLAVVAFFFEIGPENKDMNSFIDQFKNIHFPDDEKPLPATAILDFLPWSDPEIDFFRYNGSLTTPPCYESVIWSVAQKTLVISHHQLEEFRGLINNVGTSLEDNFRPTQPLHGRVVTSTSKHTHMGPYGHHH